MRIAGIIMVRNRAALLSVNVPYHFSIGFTDLYVVDNGSADETPQVLTGLARRYPGLHVRCDDGPFEQARITTEVAREAWRAGAAWIVPIDADEFWWTPAGLLPAALAGTTAAAVRVDVVNFVQTRDVLSETAAGLLTMTRRAARTVGSLEEAEGLVSAGDIAYVEMTYPPKWVSRASAAIEIAPGNHGVEGVHGLKAASESIACLHAPLIGRSALRMKAEHGRRVEALGPSPGQSWHVRRWARLESEGLLDAEWPRNSWRDEGAGVLDLPSGPHPLVVDLRLRDAVAPFVPRSPHR